MRGGGYGLPLRQQRVTTRKIWKPFMIRALVVKSWMPKWIPLHSTNNLTANPEGLSPPNLSVRLWFIIVFPFSTPSAIAPLWMSCKKNIFTSGTLPHQNLHTQHVSHSLISDSFRTKTNTFIQARSPPNKVAEQHRRFGQLWQTKSEFCTSFHGFLYTAK